VPFASPEPPAAGDAAPDAAAAKAEAPPSTADAPKEASPDEPPKTEEPAAEAASGDGYTTEKPLEADPARAELPGPRPTYDELVEAILQVAQPRAEEGEHFGLFFRQLLLN